MSFILRLSANRFPENPQDPDLENERSPTTIWSRSIRPLLGIVHLAVVGRSPTQLVLEERLWVRTLITRIVNYVVSPSHVFSLYLLIVRPASSSTTSCIGGCKVWILGYDSHTCSSNYHRRHA